jgi:polar amino acid transport system substrate-binding protein
MVVPGAPLAGAVASADPLYVAFSPKSPMSREHARVLDEGIAAMRASGELAALLKRYGLQDWR